MRVRAKVLTFTWNYENVSKHTINSGTYYQSTRQELSKYVLRFQIQHFENWGTSGLKRYSTRNESPNPLFMHIFVISRSRLVCLDILFLFLGIIILAAIKKERIFAPPLLMM